MRCMSCRPWSSVIHTHANRPPEVSAEDGYLACPRLHVSNIKHWGVWDRVSSRTTVVRDTRDNPREPFWCHGPLAWLSFVALNTTLPSRIPFPAPTHSEPTVCRVPRWRVRHGVHWPCRRALLRPRGVAAPMACHHSCLAKGFFICPLSGQESAERGSGCSSAVTRARTAHREQPTAAICSPTA